MIENHSRVVFPHVFQLYAHYVSPWCIPTIYPPNTPSTKSRKCVVHVHNWYDHSFLMSRVVLLRELMFSCWKPPRGSARGSLLIACAAFHIWFCSCNVYLLENSQFDPENDPFLVETNFQPLSASVELSIYWRVSFAAAPGNQPIGELTPAAQKNQRDVEEKKVAWPLSFNMLQPFPTCLKSCSKIWQ